MGATHQPCPDCGSSDALQINDDGSTFCHSCKKITQKNTAQYVLPDNYIKGKVLDIPERGLYKEVCKKYSYTVASHNGKLAHIATYKDLDGNPKWQKVRYVEDKEFFVNKLTKSKSVEPLLYGMHLYKGNNKKLTITEGEIDCLSVSQIFNNKYAIVSLPLGASSAEKAIRHNIEWLNRFDEIYLMFDNDDTGIEASKRAAELLPVGKVRIVSLPLKDANEMLMANRAAELEIQFYRAVEYRPDGIVYGAELKDLISKPVEWGLPYPFESLTQATYGLRIPEYILFGAGSGIGKTTIMTALENHFNHVCNQTVGIIHLEQQVRETCLYLMSNYAKKPVFRPDIDISPEEKDEIFEKCINNGRFYFYNAFGCKDFQVVKNIIRYLVVGKGCNIIFLDHISAFASGVRAGYDVNQTMKNISSELASLTRELNFTLIAVSHLRKSTSNKSWENGECPTMDDFEGSSDIVKWTNFVLTLSRNKNAQGDEKHISMLHCLKDRYTGKADGLIIPIKYDAQTCQLFENTECAEFVNEINEEEKDDRADSQEEDF